MEAIVFEPAFPRLAQERGINGMNIIGPLNSPALAGFGRGGLPLTMTNAYARMFRERVGSREPASPHERKTSPRHASPQPFEDGEWILYSPRGKCHTSPLRGKEKRGELLHPP